MDQSVSAAALIAGAILLISGGYMVRLVTGARQERFRHFIGQYREDGVPLGEDEPSFTWRDEVTKRLNRILARRDFVESMRRDLLRAGIQVAPARFFLVRVLLALGGALLVGTLLRWQGPFAQLVGGCAGLVGGYLLVRPILTRKQQQRLDAFEKHFGDALDILVGGLESGSSLTAAVELVSREMPPPISTEFARVLRDASLGMSYEEAFSAMYERLPSDDLGMFVSAVSVQFRVGGNLATLLRTLGATVRDRIRIRGDIKTLTAQQRMTGWLVTGIPFAMVGMLLLINPSYMRQIFQPGPSRSIALVGLLLIFFGNFVIRRILRIEV
jgi:tight adherence protein B